MHTGHWFLFTPDQIKRLPRVPCVYALYVQERLVYIGKTVNLYNRFASAHRYRRNVTHAKARRCHVDDLDVAERRLIRRLKPRDNQNFTGRPQPRGVRPWRVA